jgi:hypothetical protein
MYLMKKLASTIAALMLVSLITMQAYRFNTAFGFVQEERGNNGAQASNSNSSQEEEETSEEEAKPTPTPKSNRQLCIEADPGACLNYSKELEKECGAAPVLGSQPTPQDYEANSKWIACMRKAQCWRDRVYALNQVDDLCKAGEDKPECVEARDRMKHMDPDVCDKPQPVIFQGPAQKP